MELEQLSGSRDAVAVPVVSELGLELWENTCTEERDLFVSEDMFIRMYIHFEVDYRRLNLPPAITVEEWAERRKYRIPPRKSEGICPNCGHPID